MKPLHSVVQEQLDSYVQDKVRVTEQYEFSQYETINQIENFMHSRFTSGQFDSRGNPKPFFNITKGKVNIAIRATDIDRKDITMKETNSDDYFRSFVASKYNHFLMNKMRLQDYLNEWGEALPEYGSVITKVVQKGKNIAISVSDWQTTVCDPVDFDSSPVIEQLTFTPAQLRAKVSEGWDEDVIEALIDVKSQKQNLKGETVYELPNYVTVYEVHGVLPIAYLKDAPDDRDYKKYTRQMQVVAMHTNPETNKREDFTLYRGKEKKSPYSISHWKKSKGRTLGVGVVEDMFEPQIWHNYGAKKLKDQLDLASTTIFQTADGNLAARNVLNNLQNGDFIITADQKTVSPINVTPQGVEGWQNYMAMVKTVGEDITSTPEAIQGQTMPSGTAFRQVAMLNTEAHSYFDYITQNKGDYLEFLYREYFIPYIVKQLDNSDEIVAILDSHEIEFFDNAVADIAVTEELKKQTLAGNVVSPYQLDALRAQKLQDLKKTGAKRYMKPGSKTWKQYFKDFEWEVDMNITGETEDKQSTMTTLFNALQMIAQFPNLLADPTGKLLFMRLLEESDVISPMEIENASTQPQTQQPQGGPQQQMQPGQPQMPQPGNIYQGGAQQPQQPQAPVMQ